MIPLSVPYNTDLATEYVQDCLDTGWVGFAGKYIDALENKMKEITGAEYAIACQTGTAGLHLSLLATGVGAGDQVIVPSITFVATVAVIRYVGAEPIFMDCDEELQIDVHKMREFLLFRCLKTDRGLMAPNGRIIKAIMPVHIFGSLCDIESIMELAADFGLAVIEDSCEALGTTTPSWFRLYPNRYAGTIGDVGVFSFSPNKILTAGTGGCVVTNDKKIAEKVRHLGTTAKSDSSKYIHDTVGYNYRMSNVHAALGLAQLEMLDEVVEKKRQNFQLYQEMLDGKILLYNHSYTVKTSNCWFYGADATEAFRMPSYGIVRHLAKEGIESRPLWYANHLQEPYKDFLTYKIELAAKMPRRIINVPCSASLTESEIRHVCNVLTKYA